MKDMPLFETIDRIHRIHKLIQREATGTPDEFAKRFHLKRRQLYNILDEFKDYGANIRYSRTKSTFYYANDFEIMIKISTAPLSAQEQTMIFAGNTKDNPLHAISLHRRVIALYHK